MSINTRKDQGQFWGVLAAGVMIVAFCTVAFHHANARAVWHPACADLTNAAECGVRVAEAL